MAFSRHLPLWLLTVPVLFLLFGPAGCPSNQRASDAGRDAGVERMLGFDGGPDSGFCSLPGSMIYVNGGFYTVPGADAGQPDLSWLTVPAGFCVHHFAVVPNARQMRFAPGGELFVASPSTTTPSGGENGLGAVVVVPDDNHDGFGDRVLTYADGLASTQGLLFANGSLYYQDGTQIMREPYVSGQRTDNPNHTLVADIIVPQSPTHWPKTLDVSDTGQIFVGNGGDQGEDCVQPMPFRGGILQIDGSPGGAQVAMGLRNPIAVKCHRDGNNHCYATELDRDGSASAGGREKLLPIQVGGNWGYPCCATANLPFPDVLVPCSDNPAKQCAPDCSLIVSDTNSFLIGDTPFGFDFVDDQFPSPWSDRVMVGLHGAYGTWSGARVVAIAFDPRSGDLMPSTDDDEGVNSGSMVDFATGWDDDTRTHGRPTDVEMSPDGRLFVADDQLGEIFWIAPVVQ
jgi:glucose/arabinose dehydrogenase